MLHECLVLYINLISLEQGNCCIIQKSELNHDGQLIQEAFRP